ncbi:DUF4174 domain-containing protein [Sphingomonas sp. RHCKR7]|uniref:DUF4174 domain-containing protein n=1 Tax=Sphingomonas folli TaxID=2862497 RepID=UPI001C66EEC5|nr:DUF4174 domain-containing protein [Sphingomonas folli]MBW6525833.1 DUF4174 domain-containing protein [Sphingomonas folli]
MLLASLLLSAAAPGAVGAMRWEKRVLLVAAPSADDPRLLRQRRIVARWSAAAAERDLVMVEVVGDRVTGASDAAATLRRRYRLPAGRFAALLIGKDGGSKLREERPIAAATLEETIDAMPMRRNGGR